MSKSPGHRKWPEHKVTEQQLGERVKVEVNGKIVADSDNVLKVAEDEQPDRFYFPRSDIRMDTLVASDTTTKCPFKGTAHYFSIRTDGEILEDSAWTYQDPYDEHTALKDRVAFYEGDGIRIQPGV
jgi:uncharacterized protein (DUF427 family)